MPTWLTSQPREVPLIAGPLRSAIREAVSAKAPWPLVIVGKSGTGKTSAGLAMLDYAGGQYCTADSLCENLIAAQQGRLSWRAEGQSGSIWPEQFWRNMERTPLVVLDELGARSRVSDFTYNTVKRLVDLRQGKPLVCISNLSLSELTQVYDDRLASRLAAGTVVILDGPDRRLEGNG